MERMTPAIPVVAVVGATGHTGRFVVAELLRREMTPVAVARNPAALAAFPHLGVSVAVQGRGRSRLTRSR